MHSIFDLYYTVSVKFILDMSLPLAVLYVE